MVDKGCCSSAGTTPPVDTQVGKCRLISLSLKKPVCKFKAAARSPKTKPPPRITRFDTIWSAQIPAAPTPPQVLITMPSRASPASSRSSWSRKSGRLPAGLALSHARPQVTILAVYSINGKFSNTPHSNTPHRVKPKSGDYRYGCSHYPLYKDKENGRKRVRMQVVMRDPSQANPLA